MIVTAVQPAMPSHRNNLHIMVKDLRFPRIAQSVLNANCPCFLQRDDKPHIMILIGQHLVRVKPKNITVPYAVCYAVPVKFIPEYGCSGVHLLLVLVLNGRPCEAKEYRLGKRPFYGCQHISKGGAVTLINDKYNPFRADFLNVRN